MSNYSSFASCDNRDLREFCCHDPFHLRSEECRHQTARTCNAPLQEQLGPFQQPLTYSSSGTGLTFNNVPTTGTWPASTSGFAGATRAVHNNQPQFFEYPRYYPSVPSNASHGHRSINTANLTSTAPQTVPAGSRPASLGPAAPCIPTNDLYKSQQEQKSAENAKMKQGVLFDVEDTCSESNGRQPLLAEAHADKDVNEAIRRLDSTSLILSKPSSKNWCPTRLLDDTCTIEASHQPCPKSKYVSFGPTIPNKDVASKLKPIPVPVIVPVVSKPDCASPDPFHPFAESQATTRGAIKNGSDERKRHEEWIRKLEERDCRLEQKCKQIKEEGLRRLVAAASGGESSKVVSRAFEAEGIRDDGASQGDVAVHGLLGREMENEEATPRVSRPNYNAKPDPMTVKETSREKSSSMRRVLGSISCETCETDLSEKTKNESVTRIREAVNVLVAKKKVEVEVKWTSVDLSDDEDWEKIGDDEGAGWEVLEG